ncbi:MAG: hypothetical protein ACREQQ_01470 [Candidatus Binatia bacterium]
MPSRRTLIVLAPWLGAAAWIGVAAAQSGASGGNTSPLESPYKSGPPPVTGGYTDTSRDGTKTSGDPQAAPPGSGATSTQQKNDQDAGTKPDPRMAKDKSAAK